MLYYHIGNVIWNFVVFNQLEVVSLMQYNFLLQLYHKHFCETIQTIFWTLHQISMELPLSCKKILLFMIYSTKSRLHLQSQGWQRNIQELVLMSQFWQKWNLLSKHVQKQEIDKSGQQLPEHIWNAINNLNSDLEPDDHSWRWKSI